jgi:hypothetical protein
MCIKSHRANSALGKDGLVARSHSPMPAERSGAKKATLQEEEARRAAADPPETIRHSAEIVP